MALLLEVWWDSFLKWKWVVYMVRSKTTLGVGCNAVQLYGIISVIHTTSHIGYVPKIRTNSTNYTHGRGLASFLVFASDVNSV